MSDAELKSTPKNIRKEAPKPEATAQAQHLRFTIAHRIEHWVFMASFTLLGLTGLVQKYASNPVSVGIITALGGIEATRQIHHIAAIVMMLVTIYHIGVVAYRVYVQRLRMSMLPDLRDARNAVQALLYNLGFNKHKPQQGRYTFEEKVEYWAVVWGTVVMAVTGFMMWNPIASARFLPGEAIPAAKAAHGGEAVLAVLSIALWHMYHVLVRHFNKSMFTGYISEKEMLHEHPLELADIKAGIATPPPDPQGVLMRRRRFIPVYSVLAVVMLAGVMAFVSFEQTAIETLPPAEQVTVFVPLTPTPLPTPAPTRTPLPGGIASWEAGAGEMLKQRCGVCHNPSGRIGGLDLTDYAAALRGGSTGPGIVPGEPSQSLVVLVQEIGGHAEQLSDVEIEQLRAWIEAGAPEN